MRIFSYISAALLATLLVGCDGDARPFEEAVEVRTENLKSIAIVPPAITVEKLILNIGESVQFGVQGTSIIDQLVELENTDRQWQVTDPSVASITDDGQLVALANGDVGVQISIGGLQAENYDLSVSDAELSAVQRIVGEATIERCLPQDYQAVGLFGDGSERDLTGVNWSLAAADTDNARLQNNPDTTVTVTGLNPSTVTLTAALDGFSLPTPVVVSDSLQSLEISPTTGSVTVGNVAAFAAFGKYTVAAATDDADAVPSVRDLNVTESVDWEIASGTQYATVSNSGDTRGEVTGVASGIATLQASCGGTSASPIAVTVSASSSSTSDELSFSDGDTLSMIVGNVVNLRVSTGTVFNATDELDQGDLDWELSVDTATNPAISLDDTDPDAGQIVALAAGNATVLVTDPDTGATGSIRVVVTEN